MQSNKATKIGFSVFAGCAIIFGFVRVWQNIQLTFAQDGIALTQQASDTALDQVRLQALDSDHDGLSDYAELYQYDTSPYIADSDSDGISDKDELQAGTNPNCGEGAECGGLVVSDQQTEPVDSAIDVSAGTGASQISDEAAAALDVLNAGGTLSADNIRALLRNAGVSDDQLSNASDEDLMKLFNDVAAEGTAPTTAQ